MNKIMKKNYFEPKSEISLLQSIVSQCQIVSPTVINTGDPVPGMFD